MRRVLATLLLGLLLLAPPAWGGEPERPPPIDPVEVGRLLLSKDEDERTRGTRLLSERIRRGGDLESFLAAMAKAQSAWADAEARLVARLTEKALRGTKEERVKALRVLAALGEDAMRAYRARRAEDQRKRRTPRTPSSPTASEPRPSAPVAAPPRDQKDAPAAPPPVASQGAAAPAPTASSRTTPSQVEEPTRDRAGQELEAAPLVRLVGTVLEVPTAEIETWLAEEKDREGSREALRPLRRGEAVVLTQRGRFAFARAEALPEARSRQPVLELAAAVGRAVDLVPGRRVRYRRRVAAAGKGAWGVERDELVVGLSVSARVEPRATGLVGGLPYELVVEVRHTDVPLPMRVERVRPASNVEPLELDRPEWQTAVTVVRAKIDVGGEDVVAFVPGVVPERIVVVSVGLRSFDVPHAATRGRR